ncbi:MAG: nucleotide exchange factor GrpE [bacterium]|nr:nucleotide exchange factor GrpE [bacterium]
MTEERKKNEAPETESHDEVDFEPEEEFGTFGAAKAKLAKLRAELEKCKEEKQEYLVGWQRCKADSINAKKDAINMAERAGNRARDSLIEDIIPALDSFDMAISSGTWATMDENWRRGMENVRSQLLSAIYNQGVEDFAEIGDEFDPAMHEAVQEVEENGGKPGTIANVIRRGYRRENQIIRAAQVSVVVHKK